MRVTSEGVELAKGERFGAAVIVEPSVVRIVALGGLPYLEAQLEDVGFSEVHFHSTRPAWWPATSTIPTPPDFEWVGWFEGTAPAAETYRRELTPDLRIVGAVPLAAPGLAAPKASTGMDTALAIAAVSAVGVAAAATLLFLGETPRKIVLAALGDTEEAHK